MDEHAEVDEERVYPLSVQGGQRQAFERVCEEDDHCEEEGHDEGHDARRVGGGVGELSSQPNHGGDGKEGVDGGDEQE